jgi:hypothetical protein
MSRSTRRYARDPDAVVEAFERHIDRIHATTVEIPAKRTRGRKE